MHLNILFMKTYVLNFLQERDKDGTGLMSYEQQIYRIYQVRGFVRCQRVVVVSCVRWKDQ